MNCPNCDRHVRRRLAVAAGDGKRRIAHNGDVMICGCGTLSIHENGVLREPAPLEMLEIAADPTLIAALATVREIHDDSEPADPDDFETTVIGGALDEVDP